MISSKKYRTVFTALLTGLMLLACVFGPGRVRALASGAPVFGTGSGTGSEPSGTNADNTAPGANTNVEITEESVIPDGVYIGETPVGGMTIREARELLRLREEEITQAVLTITCEDQEMSVPFTELELTFEDTTDILFEAAKTGQSGTLVERYKALKNLSYDRVVCTWTYDFDLDQAEQRVAEFAQEIFQTPVEATISRSGDTFHVTESRTGISVDVETTIELLREALTDWDGGSVTVAAAAEIVEPKCTTEQLSTIKTIIADAVTGMGGDIVNGRGKNVARGAELINGTLLMPGESFSAFAKLAPFTPANGYDTATAFYQGGYVDDWGGGVCQLTTTLYNAVMYAELQVDRRYNHSMVISYARPGFDSTVNGDGSKDLVFTNNYDFPIYIEARVWSVNEDVGQCYFAIWGTRTAEMAARDVTLYYDIIEQEDAEWRYVEDPTLAPGEQVIDQNPYPRLVVNAYKKVTVNGQVVSDQLLYTDRYIRSDGIIRINSGNQ